MKKSVQRTTKPKKRKENEKVQWGGLVRMKDGEVEEGQGGYGLVLGRFYANALAPFPLPSSRWPSFHPSRPATQFWDQCETWVGGNLWHMGIIRISIASFKSLQIAVTWNSFSPSPPRQNALRATCHFHAWPSGPSWSQLSAGLRVKVIWMPCVASHALLRSQISISTSTEFFITITNQASLRPVLLMVNTISRLGFKATRGRIGAVFRV